MWRWRSPIGELRIVRTSDGAYGFEFCGVIWEACPTPEIELSNICAHSTCCDEWDESEYDCPSTLSEWVFQSDV